MNYSLSAYRSAGGVTKDYRSAGGDTTGLSISGPCENLTSLGSWMYDLS